MFDGKSEFIRAQLETLPKYKHINSRNATMVCCPWHGDRTPSLRVSHSGRFRCYGCPAKGDYDELAVALGLEPYQRDPLKPARVIRPVVVKVDSDKDACDLSSLEDYRMQRLPPNKRWRGISTNLLIDIGCQLMQHLEYGTRYVYMPVNVRRETVGFTRARLRKTPWLPVICPRSWTVDTDTRLVPV